MNRSDGVRAVRGGETVWIARGRVWSLVMSDGDDGVLQIEVRKTGDITVVVPSGDVDLTASPTLRAELRKVHDGRPPKIVVDLSGVPYMDSSGVATLVEAMQLARKNRTSLVLCCLTDRVKSIFEIAKLEMVFKIVPTLDDAMKA